MVRIRIVKSDIRAALNDWVLEKAGIAAILLTDVKTRQETQLSLTNRATHLCICNAVADLQKYVPPHIMLPCQNVVILH